MSQRFEGSVFAKKRLEMSEFIANELLYDYVVGHLDEGRKKAIETHLENSEANRQDKQKIVSGLKYCEKLADFQVSEHLLSELELAQTFWGRLSIIVKPNEWPQPVRWSLEGLVVAALVGIVLSRFPVTEYFLAKEKNDNYILADGALKPKSEPGESPLLKTEETSPPEAPKQEASVGSTEREVEKKVAEVKKKKTPPKPAVAPRPTPKKTVALDKKPPSRPNVVGKAAGNAFVYRMYIFRPEVESIAESVISDIAGLGGKKAGQVELGWRKENGRYFHFMMNKKGHDELVEKLNQYGSVRIRKSKHSRVMEADTFRYILWMEETR